MALNFLLSSVCKQCLAEMVLLTSRVYTMTLLGNGGHIIVACLVFGGGLTGRELCHQFHAQEALLYFFFFQMQPGIEAAAQIRSQTRMERRCKTLYVAAFMPLI